MNRKPKIALLFLLSTAVLTAAWGLSRSTTVQVFGDIVARVPTEEKLVALTFDDGPTRAGLDELLPVLRARGAKATFFLVGSELERRPDLGRRIAAEGHELGNHSYSHQRMVFKSPTFVSAELEKTDHLIRAAGHQGPIHFRPPYGKKLIVLPYLLDQQRRTTITWDLAPESDLEVAASSEGIVGHVLSRAKPGSIILLHVMYPSRTTSMKAVPGIIDGLQAQGYRFVTVSELLQSGKPSPCRKRVADTRSRKTGRAPKRPSAMAPYRADTGGEDQRAASPSGSAV